MKTKRLYLTLKTVYLLSLFSSSTIRGAETAADPAKLAEVLGSAADWKLNPAQPVLGGEPGPPTISAPAGLNLESSGKQAAPSECVLSFRLKPAKGASAYVQLQMACAERPDKTAQVLNFSVGTTAGLKYV